MDHNRRHRSLQQESGGDSTPVELPQPGSPLRPPRRDAQPLLGRLRSGLARRYYVGQEYAESAATRSASLHRFVGTEKGSGAALRMSYFGSGSHLAYVLGLVYDKYRVEEERGSLAVWQARRWLQDSRGRVDLLVADLPWPYHRLLRGRGLLEAPAWVDQRLRLPARWEDVFARLRSSARREDLRKIRRHRLSYRIVRDEDAISSFYREMYVPHVTHRFGEAAYVEPEWKIGYCVEHGALMQVFSEGHLVAGQVLYGDRDRLQFLWAGTHGAESGLQPKGAFPALFYFGLLYAFENGFDEADYCGSRPVLSDGVLQLKRRWGGAVYDGWSRDTLFLGPGDLGAANAGFLSRCPMIVRSGRGLVGKLVWGPGAPGLEDVARIAQDCVTPGLDIVQVYSLGKPNADVVAAGAANGCAVVDLSRERDPVSVLCRE